MKVKCVENRVPTTCVETIGFALFINPLSTSVRMFEQQFRMKRNKILPNYCQFSPILIERPNISE